MKEDNTPHNRDKKQKIKPQPNFDDLDELIEKEYPQTENTEEF